MPNPKSIFCPIAPKPLKSQELFIQNSDIIAVVTFSTPSLEDGKIITNKTQITVFPTNTFKITVATAKIHKKKVKMSSPEDVEGEGGWNDKSTGLLISFFEKNFSIYKKNKSNFTKTVTSKFFWKNHGNK